MAGSYDFTLVAGTDFTRSLTWLDVTGTPVNLTGWTARMQIRGWPVPALYATLSTAGATITLGGSAGTIALSLPASVTVTIPAGDAKYDLLMTNAGGGVSCLLEGDMIVRAAVTQ